MFKFFHGWWEEFIRRRIMRNRRRIAKKLKAAMRANYGF